MDGFETEGPDLIEVAVILAVLAAVGLIAWYLWS